jgi:hypothetical protein
MWRINDHRLVMSLMLTVCSLISSQASARSPASAAVDAGYVSREACYREADPLVRLGCYDRLALEEKIARQKSVAKPPGKPATPGAPDRGKQPASDEADRAAFEQGRAIAATEGLRLVQITGKPLDRVADPCAQRWFVRADPLDNFFYDVNAGYGNAKGASVSYTNDEIAKTQAVTIDGIVSYVLTNTACIDDPVPLAPYISGFALAPWVSANGTLNEPFKPTEKSALKAGFDVQIEAAYTGMFDRQYFSASPYYQTDFRDQARVEGLTLAWEPVQHLILLGQGRPLNDFIGGFWQLRAEADITQVDSVGLTKLALGRHDWVGATARANVFFFPIGVDHPWAPWLLNRISFVGTAQFFRDTDIGRNVRYYTAALQYQLSSNTSISFEYDTGTSKDTLVSATQYLVKLNYKQ